jgi:hypothetical protein
MDINHLMPKVNSHIISADQLTLSQPGGADYAPHITTGTLGFSDLPTALILVKQDALKNSMSLLLLFFIDILVIVC